MSLGKSKSIDLKLLLASFEGQVEERDYFAKYLKQFGWEPIVITVDEKAAYPSLDKSLLERLKLFVIKTTTREPLKLYSRLISGANAGIPQGE